MSNTTFRPRLTPLATAIALAVPVLGFAQSDATPQADQVVITAQKRTERIKDAAVAASVVGEGALEQANATDISDINKLVPSVQLKGTFNGRVPLAIRGISTNANEGTIGLTSGVAILVDGVPVPSDSFGANELQDIARVEVLKGPQSTLGGRTASAGVINMITTPPAKKLSGNMGVTVTNDNERRINGFVSGPINDVLGFSLSGYTNQREYPIKNLANGENSNSHGAGLRGKLAFHIDRDLDVTVTGHSAESKSNGSNFTYQYLTPGVALFPYFPWGPGGVSQAQSFPGVNIGYGNKDYYSKVPMYAKVNSDDASVNIEKRFNGYTFTSTTAYQKERSTTLQDVTTQAVYFLNQFPPPFPPTQPTWNNDQILRLHPKSFTQEFKIASPLDRPMSYVAGLFYSDVDVKLDSTRNMWVNPNNATVDSRTKSTALYGRATWNLTTADSLLTGLRYNRDHISYSRNERDQFNAPTFNSANSNTSNTTVGDLTLRHKFNSENMVYGTYAKGYKPKAFNTALNLSSNTPFTPVDKDNFDHYEIGSKNTLMGGRLLTNVALFNTVYKNYQVQLYPPGSLIPNVELANAAKAQTTGLEFDAAFALTRATKINFSAAYIDAKFKEFKNAPCYPGQTVGASTAASGACIQDLSGKPMPDSSKLKYNLGVEHTLADGIFPWTTKVNATYAHRSGAFLQGNQNPYTYQKGFGILNLSATATSPDGKYAVTGFVNNVTNRFYLVNAEDFFSALYANPTTFAPANAVIGQPARDAQRYFGMRFNVYFD